MRRAVWGIIRWFLFRMDAENAHRRMVSMIHAAIRLRRLPLRVMAGAPALPAPAPRVFGMDFLSRVGLAAGFDKNAEILEGLPALGFGFAEIGTVTPRPQPGNDRPRLYRNPAEQTVFNRMGFNGLGSTIVSERVARARPRLPAGFRVGVNIGKNKDTPLEEAARDYARAVTPFEGLADYIVINVSSPNTPGLRSLQTVEALKPIYESVDSVISKWSSRPPLLMKLAPEIRGEDLARILEAGESWGASGWVLTNTLGGTWKPRSRAEALPGGWSGRCLTQLSREALIEARALTKLPIISVGGIMTPDEAAARRQAGAELVQLYSGWIFGGPSFPVEVSRRLAIL